MHEYTMTAFQSYLWDLGGHYATRVADALAEAFQAVELTGDVLVLVDNGEIAFTLELGLV